MFRKILFLLFIVFVFVDGVEAREGLFIKFSLGKGNTEERSAINDSTDTNPAKNHAIGWGFSDMFALFISDFGGLIKLNVGEYEYINLDAIGLGLMFNFTPDTSISLAAANGQVSFARNWSEATGENKEYGDAINISLDKEWLISKRWGIGIGIQYFNFKTEKTGYDFVNKSINFAITFYFTAQR